MFTFYYVTLKDKRNTTPTGELDSLTAIARQSNDHFEVQSLVIKWGIKILLLIWMETHKFVDYTHNNEISLA